MHGFNTVKQSILLKLLYRLNTVSTKISLSFFLGGGDIGKLILKGILKVTGPSIAKGILTWKSKVGVITLGLGLGLVLGLGLG